jgi:hypothetical protein
LHYTVYFPLKYSSSNQGLLSIFDRNLDINREISLKNGDTSDRLVLPLDRQGVSALRGPNRVSAPETEQLDESMLYYCGFTTHLWSLAPDDYPLLFSILHTLESEHMLSIGADPRVFLLDEPALELITDDLCVELMDAVMDADVPDFIAELCKLLQEMRDGVGEEDLFCGTLLDPRVEEDREADDAMSVEDDSVVDSNGDPLVRLPDPARGAMQNPSGDGFENPQGRLCSNPLVDASASTGDAETSRPGGLRDEYGRLVNTWHGC